MHASTLRRGRVVEEPSTPVSAADFIKVAGLRLVRPYYFDYICSVKDRWQGKGVIDVLHDEFPGQPRAFYEAAYADGRLRVEGAPPGADASLPLGDGLRIRHYTHRHEPPVLDVPIPMLGMTEALVAIGKPPSMPVHASGQHRKNSVVAVLEAEAAHLGLLRPVHRLDKGVSGVLLFARSAAAATELSRRIEAHDVEKVYVARVCGAFPAESLTLDVALAWNPRTNHVTVVPGGPLAAAAARKAAAAAAGSFDTAGAAKPALTEFRRLAIAPDGCTSLVECRPRTGRTHQIRVHLQALGHPVANDVQYGGTYPGPERFLRGGKAYLDADPRSLH
ncbi:hypothetical protein WJX81_003573 [Elliptochloris bilobata]|uniref:Pseudouridine synthase RsuA/RluA-like domain-containing protein n=1 Tax=Elliptochloris bilobata TaxID=381761 RepID=A0AAW1SDT5_9CHLO